MRHVLYTSGNFHIRMPLYGHVILPRRHIYPHKTLVEQPASCCSSHKCQERLGRQGGSSRKSWAAAQEAHSKDSHTRTLHHRISVYMYCTTRNPILLVYEVYARSCRTSIINRTTLWKFNMEPQKELSTDYPQKTGPFAGFMLLFRSGALAQNLENSFKVHEKPSTKDDAPQSPE